MDTIIAWTLAALLALIGLGLVYGMGSALASLLTSRDE